MLWAHRPRPWRAKDPNDEALRRDPFVIHICAPPESRLKNIDPGV